MAASFLGSWGGCCADGLPVRGEGSGKRTGRPGPPLRGSRSRWASCALAITWQCPRVPAVHVTAPPLPHPRRECRSARGAQSSAFGLLKEPGSGNGARGGAKGHRTGRHSICSLRPQPKLHSSQMATRVPYPLRQFGETQRELTTPISSCPSLCRVEKSWPLGKLIRTPEPGASPVGPRSLWSFPILVSVPRHNCILVCTPH